MKKNISPKYRKIILITIFGVIFLILFFLNFKFNYKTQIYYSIRSELNKDSNFPTILEIPILKIGTNIESVGITESLAMDVPRDPSNVGWFNGGVNPGDIGSAVIDGHSGLKDDKPAIFDNLYKIKKGDFVYITNNKGIKLIFKVSEIKRYKPNSNSEEIFISKDGKSHLNLITCIGYWDDINKTHSDRLIVFTDLQH